MENVCYGESPKLLEKKMIGQELFVELRNNGEIVIGNTYCEDRFCFNPENSKELVRIIQTWAVDVERAENEVMKMYIAQVSARLITGKQVQAYKEFCKLAIPVRILSKAGKDLESDDGEKLEPDANACKHRVFSFNPATLAFDCCHCGHSVDDIRDTPVGSVVIDGRRCR